MSYGAPSPLHQRVVEQLISVAKEAVEPFIHPSAQCLIANTAERVSSNERVQIPDGVLTIATSASGAVAIEEDPDPSSANIIFQDIMILQVSVTQSLQSMIGTVSLQYLRRWNAYLILNSSMMHWI